MAQKPSVTKEEVRTVAQKMKQWGKTLPPNEKKALGLIMARATAAGSKRDGDDVQGFGVAIPLEEDWYGDVLWDVFPDFGPEYLEWLPPGWVPSV